MSGTKKISTKKIKKVISTKKYIPLWSWVMKTGASKVIDLSQDIERIKGLYYNNGYIQINVGEPKVDLSADKKSLSITIPIHEGDQFRYSTIRRSPATRSLAIKSYGQVRAKRARY